VTKDVQKAMSAFGMVCVIDVRHVEQFCVQHNANGGGQVVS